MIDKNIHGFGKYRGGAPLMEAATACGHAGCFLSSWGSADKLSHNPGLMGGYYGPPNPRIIIKDTDLFAQIGRGKDVDISYYDLLTKRGLKGKYRIEASGQPTEKFAEGDIMIFSTGGAGGYGDVLEREPDLVAKDLRDNMITPRVAAQVYAAAIRRDGSIDPAATARNRAARRRERLKRGKPFAEFMARWSKQRPRADIIEYYGAWPEPRVPGYMKPFWGLYA